MDFERGRQMQQDRMEGVIIQQTREEREAELADMQVDPAYNRPLPVSPCLKNKETGDIMPWLPYLAENCIELFDNCDEHGNTEYAAWSGKPPLTPGEYIDEAVSENEAMREASRKAPIPKPKRVEELEAFGLADHEVVKFEEQLSKQEGGEVPLPDLTQFDSVEHLIEVMSQ